MENGDYKILNVLNHNALLCKTLYKDENCEGTYVFFGKGIGFKRKSGEIFYLNDNIESSMQVLSGKEAELYQSLVDNVENKKLIEVIQTVVEHANQFFNNKINGNLNLTLLDHLNFAIERQKQNYKMSYPFINELKFIYPKEFSFATKALHYINQEMKGIIEFEQSELGFLTLHIHAAISNETISKVYRNNEILFTCIQIIENELHIKVDFSSIYYARFAKHLEFAIHRSLNHIHLDNILLEHIQLKCNHEYQVAKLISQELRKFYHSLEMEESEIGYLALHIYNLNHKNNDLNKSY